MRSARPRCPGGVRQPTAPVRPRRRVQRRGLTSGLGRAPSISPRRPPMLSAYSAASAGARRVVAEAGQLRWAGAGAQGQGLCALLSPCRRRLVAPRLAAAAPAPARAQTNTTKHSRSTSKRGRGIGAPAALAPRRSAARGELERREKTTTAHTAPKMNPDAAADDLEAGGSRAGQPRREGEGEPCGLAEGDLMPRTIQTALHYECRLVSASGRPFQRPHEQLSASSAMTRWAWGHIEGRRAVGPVLRRLWIVKVGWLQLADAGVSYVFGLTPTQPPWAA